MSKNIITGIDIGTQYIRVGIADNLIEGDRPMPKMIGFGIAESRGLKNGFIIDKESILKSVKQAIRLAEKSAGIRIKDAIISVGSTGLGSVSVSAETAISKADLEVTELDLEKLISLCQNEIPSSVALNKKIIHTIPVSYKLDGKTITGNPLGFKGNKLESKCLFITVLEKHLNELVELVEDLGIEVLEAVANPIASSLILLTKGQKRAGCILANIGSETISVVIYENNVPISLEVFPSGSNHITNDIALGLKVSLEEAEHIKLGGLSNSSFPRKKIDEIIEARLEDIFDLIESHLKKNGKSGLLPAGIIFTGGGSDIKDIEDSAKAYLRLPAKIGIIPNENMKNNIVKDSSWSSVYGLCLLGLSSKEQEEYFVKEIAKKTGRRIKRFFKQFMP